MKTLNIILVSLFICFCYSITIAQPLNFTPRGIGGGGALFFPKINPANDDEFYISCDMSELFHSTDFGNSYSIVHHSKLQVFNTSTYEFTNNPNIAYCNFNDGNAGYPVKTNDGGATWNKLSGYDLNNYGNVFKICANFNNPNQLLIGSYGDILFSNDGGASFTLVKHTENNGAGLVIGGVFWEGNNIYIGTNEGLITSSNSGATFSVQTTSGIPADQLLWGFAGAKSGSTTRFVCITANTGDVYNVVPPWEYYNFAKGVYTMDNANGTWVSNSSGINFANDFVMYAAMAENDINTIYLGGHDGSTGGPLVYKSINGGTSWNKVFKTTTNTNIITGWEGSGGDKNWGWSETVFGITVAAGNSNKVLFGNFSNVQSTTDGGLSWKQAYVNTADQHPAGAATPQKKAYASIGLENTTCWQVFWIDSTNMMGCFSDIGAIRSTDAGNKWGFNYTGFSVNSFYRLEKANNGKLYGACSKIHDMYQSTRLADGILDVPDADGKIVCSSDNGSNWATLHSFGHPVYWLAIDPNNQERMYASVVHFGGTQGSQLGGIYMTNNLSAGVASTWTKLANPPRTEGHPACIQVLNDGKMVCTFSGRRNSSGAFTNSSGLFIYDPTKDTWIDKSFTGMYYWTNDIVIDPNDETQSTWYVCVFSGWGGAPNGLGGLYRTTNRGTNWLKISGSQFDRVTSLTFNPQNTKQAYLTTETQGLWISDNMDKNTPNWSLVNSYPFRQPERVFFNPYNKNELWVSSFGNGMNVGSITQVDVKEIVANNDFIKIYPNPAGDFITVTLRFINPMLKHGVDVPTEIYIYNTLGERVLSASARHAVPLRINISNLPKGIYFVKVSNEMAKFVKM
ncbi:MAG: T9SS type A sorting domain-containing protein [bacterium]